MKRGWLVWNSPAQRKSYRAGYKRYCAAESCSHRAAMLQGSSPCGLMEDMVSSCRLDGSGLVTERNFANTRLVSENFVSKCPYADERVGECSYG